MASYIKNQIVKRLSKFAKNVTPDMISVEILRGKGELKNIILNEEVLTDALELPIWLNVKKAVCNRVAVRVPWTRLKSSPIKLFIDDIQVEVVMSSELRVKKSCKTQSQPAGLGVYTNHEGYGFIEKAIEGIALYINTLEISFTSELFGGSLMLQRLSIESRTPAWGQADDLRKTRIQHPTLPQSLLFKQICWQLLRIEASANRHASDSKEYKSSISAPLRLITSQGRGRLLVKKNTVDGSIVSGRIQVILDDILWVATLPQVRSAICFYRFLMDLLQKAGDISKTERAEKILTLEKVRKESTSQVAPSSGSSAKQSSVADAFSLFDVKETSFHFYVAHIDLHLCDDSSSDFKFPENWDIDTGAVQITITKLACDVYPYHFAGGDRANWVRYRTNQCEQWANQLLQHYKTRIGEKLDANEEKVLQKEWKRLMCQVFVVRLEDLCVYCVSQATSKKTNTDRMFSTDRELLPSLPADSTLIHAEFSDFYYANPSTVLPVPASSSHILLNPIRLLLDLRSIRWLHYIYQDVCKNLDLKGDSLESLLHCDVRIEAMMPRVIIPSFTQEHIQQSRTPSELRVSLSALLISNCLIGNNIKVNSLRDAVQKLADNQMFNETILLGSKGIKPLPTETTAFHEYLTALCESISSSSPGPEGIRSRSNTAAQPLNIIPHAVLDTWSVQMSPLWIDFYGNPVYYPRPRPFVLDTTFNVFLVSNLMQKGEQLNKYSNDISDCAADAYVIIQPDGPVRILVNHYQYLFVMHAIDGLSNFGTQLQSDARYFLSEALDKTAVLSLILPDLHVHLQLPVDAPASPYEERSATSQSLNSLEEISVESPTPQQDILAQVPSRPNVAMEDFPEFPNDNESILDGAEDTMSIATDVSDDDNFIVLEADSSPFDDVFPQGVNGPLANCEEAIEANAPINVGPKHSVLLDRALSKKVSLVTFHLKDVQFRSAISGDQVKANMLANYLMVSELCNSTLDQIDKIINKKDMREIMSMKRGEIPALKVQFDVKDIEDMGTVRGRVHAFKMKLNSTNAANIASFLQDDTGAAGDIKIKLLITDADITILDEKTNVPLNIFLEKSWIQIGTKETKPCFVTGKNNPSLETSNKLSELEMENEKLRKELRETRQLLGKANNNRL